MSPPEVSIVSANYNNAHYLTDAIDSVVNQSFTNWELIIVDDASSQDTCKYIASYMSDKRIKYVKHEVNAGYAAAQHTGFMLAKGDIIIVLDADDALVPGAIAKIYKEHKERQDTAIILSQMYLCDEQLHVLDATNNTVAHREEPLLWFRGVTHLRSFKRKFYRPSSFMNLKYRISSDLDLMFRLEEAGGAYRIEEPLLFYRIHGKSLSNSVSQYARSMADAAEVMLDAHKRRLGSNIPNLHPIVVQGWLSCAAQALAGDGFNYKSVRLFVLALMLGLNGFEKLTFLLELASRNKENCIFLPILRFSSNTGNISANQIFCVEGLHTAGHLIFGGDFLAHREGIYTVKFLLTGFSTIPTRCAATIDIYTGGGVGKTYVSKQLKFSELKRKSSVSFALKAGEKVEFRSFWHGTGMLTLSGVKLYLDNPIGANKGKDISSLFFFRKSICCITGTRLKLLVSLSHKFQLYFWGRLHFISIASFIAIFLLSPKGSLNFIKRLKIERAKLKSCKHLIFREFSTLSGNRCGSKGLGGIDVIARHHASGSVISKTHVVSFSGRNFLSIFFHINPEFSLEKGVIAIKLIINGAEIEEHILMSENRHMLDFTTEYVASVNDKVIVNVFFDGRVSFTVGGVWFHSDVISV
jgi:glycosyltransferase involved in cell wall biosynthesis